MASTLKPCTAGRLAVGLPNLCGTGTGFCDRLDAEIRGNCGVRVWRSSALRPGNRGTGPSRASTSPSVFARRHVASRITATNPFFQERQRLCFLRRIDAGLFAQVPIFPSADKLLAADSWRLPGSSSRLRKRVDAGSARPRLPLQLFAPVQHNDEAWVCSRTLKVFEH